MCELDRRGGRRRKMWLFERFSDASDGGDGAGRCINLFSLDQRLWRAIWSWVWRREKKNAIFVLAKKQSIWWNYRQRVHPSGYNSECYRRESTITFPFYDFTSSSVQLVHVECAGCHRRCRHSSVNEIGHMTTEENEEICEKCCNNSVWNWCSLVISDFVFKLEFIYGWVHMDYRNGISKTTLLTATGCIRRRSSMDWIS